MSDLISHVEGSLLSRKIRPEQASVQLGRWRELGVRRVVADPALLQALSPFDPGAIKIVGSVGSPSGCHTLGTKRMEALECVRLGAAALEFVPNPYHLLSGSLGETENEISSVRKTASELELTITVGWPMGDPRSQELLLRIVRTLKPQGLKLLLGEIPVEHAVETVREVTSRLHRKTFLAISGIKANRQAALAVVEAGCRWVLCERPETLLDEAL